MSLLLRRDPWNFIHQLQNNFEPSLNQPRSLTESNNEWVPTVDIKEEDDQFILYADIPGVDPKEIELTIEEGYLTLKGHREQRKTEKEAGYQKTECIYGSFIRKFKLPESVEADSITAKGEHGVLEIVIPKTKKTEPRKIQVTH